MKAKTRWLVTMGVLILVVAALLFLVWGKTIKMAKGNSLFRKGEIGKARPIYEDLVVDLPESPYTRHNLALSQYRDGQYSEAQENLAQAEKGFSKTKPFSGNKKLLSTLQYHLGNVFFKRAEQNEKEAAGFYQQALAKYKQAIEADPADRDAKYNYELALLRLKNATEQDKREERQDDKEPPQPPKQDQANQKMEREEAQELLKMSENSVQYQNPAQLQILPESGKDW